MDGQLTWRAFCTKVELCPTLARRNNNVLTVAAAIRALDGNTAHHYATSRGGLIEGNLYQSTVVGAATAGEQTVPASDIERASGTIIRSAVILPAYYLGLTNRAAARNDDFDICNAGWYFLGCSMDMSEGCERKKG